MPRQAPFHRITKSVRCTREDAARIAQVCRANHMSMGTFRICALLHYLHLMEAQGIISPYVEEDEVVQDRVGLGYKTPPYPSPTPYSFDEEADEGLAAAEEWQESEPN